MQGSLSVAPARLSSPYDIVKRDFVVEVSTPEIIPLGSVRKPDL